VFSFESFSRCLTRTRFTPERPRLPSLYRLSRTFPIERFGPHVFAALALLTLTKLRHQYKMPVYETGHARNVAQFQQLISFVDSWGAPYAPSNTAIALTALNTKLTDTTIAMDEVGFSLAISKTAINERENTFAGLRKLTTRIINYYESTGADANKIKDVRTLKRKIDGKRAKQLVDDPSTPEDESQNGISAAQMSYTQLIEHLSGIINILSNDLLYAPTEADLKLTALNTLVTNLKTANNLVIDAITGISNKRGDRNEVMYKDESGLIDLAFTVKKYVKAAFGTDSLQYSQLSGLEFKRPKK